MTTGTTIKERAAAGFNAAADLFDDDANRFLVHFGAQTVSLLELGEGEHVLDVPCGTGHSVVPAARAVGPGGRVVGVDLAERLLEIARGKAEAAGLRHVELVHGDMEALELGAERFDAVICVLGIFYASDMPALVRRFWRMLRPGGRLAITTWARDHFEPAKSGIWQPTMRRERPDLYRAFEPWERAKSPDGLRVLLEEGGASNLEIIESKSSYLLRTPDDWWTMNFGLGGRWTIDQMDDATRARVRAANVSWIRDHGVRAIETNVLYAIARKA